MVFPVGVEPTTYDLGNRRSIQLSYGNEISINAFQYATEPVVPLAPTLTTGRPLVNNFEAKLLAAATWTLRIRSATMVCTGVVFYHGINPLGQSNSIDLREASLR